jgi:hypothetical protein
LQNNYNNLLLTGTEQFFLDAQPLVCKLATAVPTQIITKIVGFKLTVFYLAKVSNNNQLLLVFYHTMDIEKHEETLLYDSGNFVAAVGSSLSIFLGISCL